MTTAQEVWNKFFKEGSYYEVHNPDLGERIAPYMSLAEWKVIGRALEAQAKVDSGDLHLCTRHVGGKENGTQYYYYKPVETGEMSHDELVEVLGSLQEIAEGFSFYLSEVLFD